MPRKFAVPQWFKDQHARYRGQRAAGDVPASEVPELLADDIQSRHETGDPFGRDIWRDYIIRYDKAASNSAAANADEAAALELASGFLQPDLFPAEVLAKLGLPPVLDLGGFGKTIDAPDATRADIEKYRAELERKRKSWDDSLSERIAAAERILELLPEDGSRTLRDIITDPDEYGFGQVAL